MAKIGLRPAGLRTHCQKGHSLDNAIVFQRKSGDRAGKRERRCRICDNAHSRQWYSVNAERALLQNRLRKYGLSAEQYDAMLRRQNGVCAICGKPETSRKTKLLSVDHDHRTNRVRGLLCTRCNVAIGLLGHDASRLHSAVDYITTNGTP